MTVCFLVCYYNGVSFSCLVTFYSVFCSYHHNYYFCKLKCKCYYSVNNHVKIVTNEAFRKSISIVFADTVSNEWYYIILYRYICFQLNIQQLPSVSAGKGLISIYISILRLHVTVLLTDMATANATRIDWLTTYIYMYIYIYIYSYVSKNVKLQRRIFLSTSLYLIFLNTLASV